MNTRQNALFYKIPSLCNTQYTDNSGAWNCKCSEEGWGAEMWVFGKVCRSWPSLMSRSLLHISVQIFEAVVFFICVFCVLDTPLLVASTGVHATRLKVKLHYDVTRIINYLASFYYGAFLDAMDDYVLCFLFYCNAKSTIDCIDLNLGHIMFWFIRSNFV